MARKKKLREGDRILYANYRYSWNKGKGTIIRKFNRGPKHTMIDIQMDDGEVLKEVSQCLVRRLPAHMDRQ